MRHDNFPIPEFVSPSPLFDKKELHRFNRLATPELQHRYQCRREMIRHSLTLYRPEIHESDWIFSQNAHGKPHIHHLQCKNNLYFNLSHTNGLTVLAIAGMKAIGIDVENVAARDPENCLKIADRFFTPLEIEDITRIRPEKQLDRFFDFWTLKEAYMKAVGKGLSIGLNRFQFVLDSNLPITINFPSPEIDVADNWTFHQQTIADNMRIAIALQSNSSERISCNHYSYLPTNK